MTTTTRLEFADASDLLEIATRPGLTFQVDAAKRTITGLAVPYGEPTTNRGQRFQFSRGSINLPSDPGHVKLLVSHDRNRAVGRATSLEDTDAGLLATFSVARGPEGDQALSMAEDRVWDGLSIGLRPHGAVFEARQGVHHAVSSDLAEISLTPDPAFSTARVATVTLEATQKENTMECPTCHTVHAPGVVACAAPAINPTGFDAAAITKAIADGFAALSTAAGPAVVNPTTSSVQVVESGPYNFDADAGLFVSGSQPHEFAADVQSMVLHGDREAEARALGFLQTQFAVAQTNVQSTLPVGQNRVGFVDRREYVYPLTNALRKGGLDNVAPFSFPRFNSLAGLVQDHTEGVEPTPGSLTTTSQTVTPKAMSGKVELTREVFDQASNPQISNFIFQKMVRTYQEALEAAVVTELTAQAANITDITIPLAAAGSALVNALLGAIVDLQYVRGGYTFDVLATQIDLFKALATAVDGSGRNLLPALNPANAMGTSARGLKSIDLDGLLAVPAWTLAATNVNRSNSWLIDSESVHLWNSVPQRLDWNFGASVQTNNLTQVAMVTIGIWGYRAVAISDLGGVRQVTYDPSSPES